MTTPTISVSRDLLEALVNSDDCELDQRGACHAHGYLALEIGEICPQRELKDILEATS